MFTIIIQLGIFVIRTLKQMLTKSPKKKEQMRTIFYDHGHSASVHVNCRSLGLTSAKQSRLLPLCCRCLLLSFNPQHCSFLSRIKASSLYVGLVYLGCRINCTFFHHSFIAWRKQDRGG